MANPLWAAPTEADLFCTTHEKVGDYLHVVTLTFKALPQGGCAAEGRHSFYMSTFAVGLTCSTTVTVSRPGEPELEAWSFQVVDPDKTERLSGLSLLYYPNLKRAVGFARLGNGAVFSVQCRP